MHDCFVSYGNPTWKRMWPWSVSGHDVANLVKDTLPRLLLERLPEMELREMFTEAGQEISGESPWIMVDDGDYMAVR